MNFDNRHLQRDKAYRRGVLMAASAWFFICFLLPVTSKATRLADSGIYVIPYPQEVSIEGTAFSFNNAVNIVLDDSHSVADEFTAKELARDLKNEWNIQAEITGKKGKYSIVLNRQKGLSNIGKQGYRLTAGRNGVIITASGEDGLFYGTQTLLQLIQKNGAGHKVIGLKITDWPDIKERAIHYDTKHHQDKMSYVKGFIRELARYKVNILVWEWEDKFAYPSHPEIAAPGAFTPQQIRDLTDYALQYHIQIAPLVQGLGHASYILKWPQYAGLREVAASNFEFCPLKQGTYDLLFDLWKDAMDATKSSQYIHIGSDETYELGLCDQCSKKAEHIGKTGLYHLFSDKAAQYIKSQGRKPMIWESPMGWIKDNPEKTQPSKNLVLTESMNDVGIDKAKEAKSLGYKVFSYVPNPGIEPLFLPYFYRIRDGKRTTGSLEHAYDELKQAAASGVFDGMIRTSWDDAGLHNQMWMLCFVNAAEFSWNGHAPGLTEFKETFFKNYYGQESVDMDRLFYLLNEGAYYYWDTFERKVWHFGDVGKTYLPDLPRGDALEYDPYWNRQHKEMINRSALELKKMDSALAIIAANSTSGVRHPYDFELFKSIVRLIRHTCQTYLDLSEVEHAIGQANQLTFVDRDSAYMSLARAVDIIEGNLKQRNQVFDDMVSTWQKTRLPKGMSAGGKNYFYRQDRTRHFANRRPDMTYLIYDEQKLGLEEYLGKLKAYMEKYKKDSF